MGKPERLKTRRPGSVVVAGWCAILAVPLILVRITWVLTNGGALTSLVQSVAHPETWLSIQGLDTLVKLLVGPIAILSLVSGIAILRNQRWAWVVLMLFLAAGLLLNLIRAYFQEPEYALMLVYAVLVLILNQPDVRRSFRVGRPSHATVE